MAETTKIKKVASPKTTATTKKAPVKKTVTPVKTEAKTTKNSTLSIDVFDTTGKVVGQQALAEHIFAIAPNKALIAQTVRVYLANQRQGTVKTKTRGEVRGSTRKIYRQKGTGRARHGGIRAPIFVGGGVTHGRTPNDFSMTMPQKMKQKALASVLSAKLKDKEVKVVTGFAKIEAKTKIMSAALVSLGLREKGKKSKVLLVINDGMESIVRGARNIEGVTLTSANRLHAYDALVARNIVFMQDAIESLEKRFEKKSK